MLLLGSKTLKFGIKMLVEQQGVQENTNLVTGRCMGPPVAHQLKRHQENCRSHFKHFISIFTTRPAVATVKPNAKCSCNE